MFKGFISGISQRVLSGGRYDNLMRRMNRSGGAVGFAVYLDDLGRYIKKEEELKVDTMLLYDDKSDIKTLNKVIDEHLDMGKTFFVEESIPENMKFSKILKIENDKITEVKGND